MPEIVATYRLQLHAGFPLSRVRDLVPYFERLGVTHLYCSPMLQARRGSTHGYDVVDPTTLDLELGSEDELAALADDLRARGMGIVLDIVPNHMAATTENPAWNDVLTFGRASRYARWFDIEWRAPERAVRFRVVLPILGDVRAHVLDRGEIEVVEENGRLWLRYWEHRFPLRPETVSAVLEHGVDAFGRGAGAQARLRRLLDAQVYRLVHWRREARALNYRRFFDVNELVALHMEDPEVFAQTHALVLDWQRRGWVDGFRVDHPDGLLDPYGYLRRLADSARADSEAGPPIFVEKILAPGERLREDWPVWGTTGYDFLNEAEALFIHPAGWDAIAREYRGLVRQPVDFATVVRMAKRRVLETGLSAGVRRLAQRLHRLSAAARPLPPLPLDALASAIVDAIVALPVYRTYVDERTPTPSGEDRRLLEAALADARARGRAGDAAVDALAAVLLAADDALHGAEGRGSRIHFTQQFQQLSGPAMAKGVEDTAFYVYAPLLSRNEVGGGPELSLDTALDRFHAGNAHRAERWPRTLLAVTTHDTKRSADARARLDVLSELSAEWEERLYRWRRWNRTHQRTVRGRRVPDATTTHHLYQAILAIWPLTPPDDAGLVSLRERLGAYAVKAAREAKTHTSWIEPDDAFEAALQEYIAALLTPELSAEFLADLGQFAARIGRFGLWNAFARTLLQLTAPGIPDIYQGDELWNYALVDPDNRRPVDFGLRTELLARLPSVGEPVDALVAEPDDGRLKLYLIHTVLQVRKRYRDLFLRGAYLPLAAEGTAARQLVAFGRRHGVAWAVTLAPRLLASLLPVSEPTALGAAPWADTAVRLPAGWPARWTCALTGASVGTDTDGRILMEQVLGRLPGALLIAEG